MTSAPYLNVLKSRRAAAAHLAERLALGLLSDSDSDPETRAALTEDMRAAARERDAYDRQIAWYRRRTGWAVPQTPAWAD